MSAFVVLVGIFGVIAGWHWKLMHQSWLSLRSAMELAKGRIPALRAARSHHTWRGIWFVFAALLVLVITMKVR